MSEIDSRFHPDLIDDSAFVASGVVIRGDVIVGADSSIWFGAVIRGDTERVRIGTRTNVQDACVIHSDPGYPCQIGDDVTIGHGAIVHGAEVGDQTLICIRAVVLNGARIGRGSIVAAGALVTERTVIPPDSLVMGVPAKVVRKVNEADQERIRRAATNYVRAAAAYRT
jgi:carbonic anhydrase/acetyltransferase-like protein (isoleucine patch superfamily)